LSESGRWLNVELMGRDERRIVKATALRSALGVDRLRSTRFNVRLRGDDLVFEGLGWGHGVGLSQEGAHVLAQRGWTYARILQHYYPGTRLAQTKP
jgi:stage II sporulation protein D